MYGYPESSRALDLADMCKAILIGRETRCDVHKIFHVLEIFEDEPSARTGQRTKPECVYHCAPAMVRPVLKSILD